MVQIKEATNGDVLVKCAYKKFALILKKRECAEDESVSEPHQGNETQAGPSLVSESSCTDLTRESINWKPTIKINGQY